MVKLTNYYLELKFEMMYERYNIKEAIEYLSLNYNDSNVNNNVTHISTTTETISQDFKCASMKQSYYKNINFVKSNFENVAFTGTSFENVKFDDVIMTGNSFANCSFLMVNIDGKCKEFVANNFSQSNFELCKLKSLKLFRSGSINTLFHSCDLDDVQLKSCTFEGAKFKNCTLRNCNFGNVNIDYSIFMDNTYNNVIFPFYQFAYIIGMVKILQNNEDKVFLQVGQKKVDLNEYKNQIKRLILYYLDKNEYFPICNLCIANGDIEAAGNYLIDGVNKFIITRNFRMISNLCFLASYHGIMNEKLRYKINRAMDEFIQGEGIPETQLNYYLMYMGKIRTILEKGSSETLTLNYTIKTNTCKADPEGVEFINDLINKLNKNLSNSNDIEGFKVTISNYSPFEIIVGVITIVGGVVTVSKILFDVVSKYKDKKKENDIANIALENGKLYLQERIDRMQKELLLARKQFTKDKLDDRIVAVTQSFQTEIEEFYSKQFMYFKVDNKKR